MVKTVGVSSDMSCFMDEKIHGRKIREHPKVCVNLQTDVR